MDTFSVGTLATIVFPLTDDNDAAVVATGLSYSLYDENEDLVSGPTAVDIPVSASEISIVIPGNDNVPTGARRAQLTITTATGSFIKVAEYLVKPALRLVVMKNSFQSQLKARMLADDIPNLLGFATSADDDQAVALIEAFNRLSRYAYTVRWPEMTDYQNIMIMSGFPGASVYAARLTPQMWPQMTVELFNRYPQAFRDALCKAQVVEADQILTGDTVADKRRAGLMSETIGESSMMFKPGARPLDLQISRPALAYLTGYIEYRMTLTRS